jgi:hypothetical protein
MFLKMTKLISSIGLLLVFCLPLSAEEISLSAALDKTDIPFESTVNLNLEIKWQGGVGQYAFELLPLPATQKLKVLGTTSAVSSRVENGHEITTRAFKYTLKPTQFGIGLIEPIILKYVSLPDSIPGQLASQQFQVIIAKPVPPPAESKTKIYLLIFISAIILASGAIFLLIRRRGNRTKKEPEKTPEQYLLVDLALIKKESLSDRKLFFTRLYKILTDYLERKYAWITAGKTTSVLLNELQNLDLLAGDKEKLSCWLTLAEKEKYAPSGGAPGDTIRLSTEIESFFKR